MTEQPLDLVRFFEFSLAAVMACLISEGVGFAIGAILDGKVNLSKTFVSDHNAAIFFVN